MIYFDNGATTKPDQAVIASFLKVSEEFFGNPSSLHDVGKLAEQLLSKSRSQVADLLNVDKEEIIFTSGGTESNNLAIKGVALQYRNRGNHIITTTTEHASVQLSCEQLKDHGFEISYLPVDKYGLVSLDDLRQTLREETILVSISHVNNEVGTVQNIAEIGRVLKEHEQVFFHVDNVQGIGKLALNLQNCHVDLASYSAHKFHGLKGTGILYKSSSCQLFPLLTGGSQEQNLRSGTENVAGIVAMAKALRLIIEKQAKNLEDLNKLQSILQEGLKDHELVQINSKEQYCAPHIFNFSLRGIKSETFIHSLSEQNLIVSTTSACSSKRQQGSKTLLAMGLAEDLAASAVRISFSYSNTSEEAKKSVEIIKNTLNKLRKVMK